MEKVFHFQGVQVNFVEPSVSLIHETDPFKRIELAGRTCYKSEDKITSGSAIKFVNALMRNGHYAMIEHASLVFLLHCRYGFEMFLPEYVEYLKKDDYIRVTHDEEYTRILVSANVRAIIQRNVYDPIYVALVSRYPEFAVSTNHTEFLDRILDNVNAEIVDIRQMKDITEDEFLNHYVFTARFVTDRGVSHEMVRHRPFSFAQESTRYCNYSKDKFGGHLTFCRPTTYDSWAESQRVAFENTLIGLDDIYHNLTAGEDGLTPQLARAILPNCIKTEIVVSGPAKEWKHFYDLRSYGVTGSPHPDIKYVADIAKKKMNKYLYSLKFVGRYHF